MIFLTPTRLHARKLTWPIESLHEMTGYSFSDVIRTRLVRRDEVNKKNGMLPKGTCRSELIRPFRRRTKAERQVLSYVQRRARR